MGWPIAVRVHLVVGYHMLSFRRHRQILRHGLPGLQGLITIQIEFSVKVLVPERGDELGAERIVFVAAGRQHELFRASSKNTSAFQGYEHAVHDVRQLSARPQLATLELLLQRAQRGNGLFHFKSSDLLFLDHVTADVPSHLLRGSLSNETQLPRARLAHAVFRRAVFVVGTLGNGHSVVALHVRIRAKDLCKNCRCWRKPLALACPNNTSERIPLPACL